MSGPSSTLKAHGGENRGEFFHRLADRVNFTFGFGTDGQGDINGLSRQTLFKRLFLQRSFLARN